MSLLSVDSLSVSLRSGRTQRQVVEGVSFDIATGEILCIVGESGSGKSITAKTLVDLLPANAKVSGNAFFDGQSLFEADNAKKLRGREIGMIFQEPMTALNPVLTIGQQLTEASVVVGGLAQCQADERALLLLDKVGIDSGPERLRQYPHEFSGGMRQRVMIAMAMMMSPRLLIADEPTTALDVTIQAQILLLLKNLVQQEDMSLVLITHDMGVVAQTADRVLVMKDGRLVESNDVYALFQKPKHSYTRQLLAAVPRLDINWLPDTGLIDSHRSGPLRAEQPLVDIRHVNKQFKRSESGMYGSRVNTKALVDVSLEIFPGETVALVGESGSGKSTLGRAVTRLLEVDSGMVTVDGVDIAAQRGASLRRVRSKTQMVFQDPYSSLDPRFSVGASVAEPMIINQVSKADARRAAEELLESVGLSGDCYHRFPHEFSGGQRQRVAVARALATKPKVLVADEPTSALDVSIQAQILALLKSLKVERGLSILFISHDLAVVRQVADRVAVMKSGQIVETGVTEDVLARPSHPYTKLLIDSAPIPDPQRRMGRLNVAGGGGTVSE